jgi:3D-(3,5/4)-trihydroxycyclohexane-1,2-dione acylhydrolase (decyclizing)
MDRQVGVGVIGPGWMGRVHAAPFCRYRDGDRTLLVDLAANAADLARVRTIAELEAALRDARASSHTTVIHVETDPVLPASSSEAWWDVPVAETAELESTRAARATSEHDERTRQAYLGTAERVEAR